MVPLKAARVPGQVLAGGFGGEARVLPVEPFISIPNEKRVKKVLFQKSLAARIN